VVNRSSVAAGPRPADLGPSSTTFGEGLATSTGADLDLAWAHREALVAAAVVLVRAAGHLPGHEPCTAGTCGLVARAGDPLLCEVTERLAGDAIATPATAVIPVEEALAAFTRALTTAADAIHCCRRTAHPSAACWFAPPGGGDGCREVLRLLHRLG
jgi:hypothetical protein